MEGPLLKAATPAVAGQRGDPQIAIGALRRISVDDLEAGHRGIHLNGHDLRGKREYLVWALALVFPVPSVRADSRKRLVERGSPGRSHPR
jgi:hypothetical protein